MATFFGVDELNAQGFIDKSVMCIPRSADGGSGLHAVVSPVRNEDIVFIKHCSPSFTLHIKAIGIVRSDYPKEIDTGLCVPVQWLWQGEIVPENCDEVLSSCGEALYEEHNIFVQREMLDQLPESYRLPQGGAEALQVKQETHGAM